MTAPVSRGEHPCPYCGADNDATVEAAGAGALPAAGNWSVCWTCGAVAVFTGEGLHTRQLTPAEALEAAADHDLQQALRTRQAWLA